MLGLRGVVRTSRTTLNCRSFLNLEAFAPEQDWEELLVPAVANGDAREDGNDL